VRILRLVGWVLLAALTIGVVALAFTLITTGRPANSASSSPVAVEMEKRADDWRVFRPMGEMVSAGFIFYPGGLVHPEAYDAFARDIAAQGYLVVVPPTPLNLAALTPNQAQEILAAFPAIRRWAIGGHSLGGAMAAQFVASHPTAVQGLALWGAYPPGTASLAAWNGQVVSIYGTLDGRATPASIEASQALLPPTTRFVPIEGGNHAQFGDYGPQRGDNPATISAEEQRRQTVAATTQMLASLK